MKLAMLTFLLVSLVPAAKACDYLGIKGQLSDDGQSIVSRQPIALKEQAKQYGGYTEAANVIEQNRLSVLQNEQISATIRRQVDNDLTANVKQLRCWAAVCSKGSADPACRL